MQIPKTPWWHDDTYNGSELSDGLDISDKSLWGPKGPAVVKLYTDGKTSPGWGQETFMKKYNAYEFDVRRHLKNYDENRQPFAWVMRASNLICIDVDGKNGGFDHVSELGYLPPTKAEISMSGTGLHLFYITEDSWDENLGFAMYSDVIGLVTGIDIRATGCVFHKPTQLWNDRPLSILPEHLSKLLLNRQLKRTNAATIIKKTLNEDPTEVLMMQAELIDELNQPIKTGKRNNTLFAIGSKMKLAEIEDWATHVSDRAAQVGLDDDEIEKLINNIDRYSV